MPSDERLREVLDYDPETGLFTRKVGKGAGGNLNAAGYVQLSVDGKFYYGHRLAWWFVYGEWPERKLDHIDGVKHHNWIGNLRLATDSQNVMNIRAKRNGLKGVYFNQRRGKWCAQICRDQIKHHLGTFLTEADAHAAYCVAAEKLHGAFARTA